MSTMENLVDAEEGVSPSDVGNPSLVQSAHETDDSGDLNLVGGDIGIGAIAQLNFPQGSSDVKEENIDSTGSDFGDKNSLDTSFGTFVRSLVGEEITEAMEPEKSSFPPRIEVITAQGIDSASVAGPSGVGQQSLLGSVFRRPHDLRPEFLDPDVPGPSGLSQDPEELENDSMKIEMLLALNAAYAETLEKMTQNVQAAIAENKKRQEAVNAAMGKSGFMIDIFGNKKKVPVGQFFPPYFRDRFGMIPPSNIETQRKLVSGDYDPLVKAEKKWGSKDLEALRLAVKRELAEKRCASYLKKRFELSNQLASSGQETTEEERMGWRQEIETLDRTIDYIRNLSDDEIFGADYDYSTVDWAKIATFDFSDSRTAIQVRLKWMNEQSPRWSKANWTPEELMRLRDLATAPWVRWEMVAKRLGTARTPFQCYQKFRNEFDKDPKATWTRNEDAELIALTQSMQVNGNIPFEKVAFFMENRNRQQCRVRYVRTLNTDLKHGRWTEEEDLLLKCAVGRFGIKNWKKVATSVPGRTDAQCRDRWLNVLDEKVKDSPWTLEEDGKLLEGVLELGTEWSRISILLPGRTGDHCKTRFRSLMLSKAKMVSYPLGDEVFYLSRRHDTTKLRRARKEIIEKHFKEMLAADGQSEVAEQLSEQFKLESLSTDDMEVLAELPPEQRNIILQMMRETRTAEREGGLEQANLYQLLQRKLAFKPEFLDNTTRVVLYKAYEKACAAKLTGRKPRQIVFGEEKSAFLESLDCLPTEEDKQKFLMDHLVKLVEDSDNADQQYLYQQIPKNRCIYEISYHLNEELIGEVKRVMERNQVPDRKNPPEQLNPLPPFAGSLRLLAALKRHMRLLRNKSSWSFNKLEEGNTAVHVQLSREIKEDPNYVALKMKLRSLLFWPTLLDTAIEPKSLMVERERLRRIQAAREKEEKIVFKVREQGIAMPEAGVSSGGSHSDLTVRDLVRGRRRTRNRAPMLQDVPPPKRASSLTVLLEKLNSSSSLEEEISVEELLEKLGCGGSLDTQNEAGTAGEALIPRVRSEAERLAMIEECIEAVCQRVRNTIEVDPDLLEEIDVTTVDLDITGEVDVDVTEEVGLNVHQVQDQHDEFVTVAGPSQSSFPEERQRSPEVLVQSEPTVAAPLEADVEPRDDGSLRRSGRRAVKKREWSPNIGY